MVIWLHIVCILVRERRNGVCCACAMRRESPLRNILADVCLNRVFVVLIFAISRVFRRNDFRIIFSHFHATTPDNRNRFAEKLKQIYRNLFANSSNDRVTPQDIPILRLATN